MTGKFYMLVNPYVEGSVDKVFKADNSLKAAKMAYDSLSKYFNNSVQNFKFTLLKLKSDSIETNEKSLSNFNLDKYGGGSNKLFKNDNFSHFIVSESRSNNNKVSYTINKFEGEIQNTDYLITRINEIQNNFKNHNTESNSSSTESSSSSSSSEQEGGDKSKYKDDDSDDSDDSPDYRTKKSYFFDPISYWYYYPSLYPKDLLLLPTYISPLSFPLVVDSVSSLSIPLPF